MVKLLAITLAKHNIKQNAEINTYNTIKKGVNKMTTRTDMIETLYAQADAGTFADLYTLTDAELESLADMMIEQNATTCRLQSYREWLADELDVNVEDITGLDMDADSYAIFECIRLEAPLCLSVIE